MKWFKTAADIGQKTAEIVGFYRFKEYVSQRKNRLRPAASCNTSAVINAMVHASLPVLFRQEGERPADTLMKLLDSPKYWQRLNQIDPGSKQNPWNYSQILTEAVNELQGRPIAKWKRVSFAEFKELLKDNTIVIGGTFGALRHFVMVHHFDGHSFVLDDSWGNAMTGYKDHNGDDVRYPEKYIKDACFFNERWKRGFTHVILFARMV